MRLADHLRPGLIASMCTRTPFGALTRAALRFKWEWRVSDIPNHDSLVVARAGKLYFGDACPPRSKLTEVGEYERRIEKGAIYNLRILSVVGATEDQERAAAEWWCNPIGVPYDFMAFPRLLWKATVGDWIPSAAGWEWAWYCTERVRDSYLHGANIDPWGKENPTPLTTFKRTLERKLKVECHINENVTRMGGVL